MLSLEDYNALEETAHLLSSPNNARRLLVYKITEDARLIAQARFHY